MMQGRKIPKGQYHSTYFDDSPPQPPTWLSHIQIQSSLHHPQSDYQKSQSQPQNYEQQSMEEDIRGKYIFKQRKPKKQNKNTPRFLVRVALKHLRNYEREYDKESYEAMIRKCQEIERWHDGDKKNVYLIDHLKELFTDGHSLTENQQKLNRRVFRQILSNEAIDELENPKSQVRKNKISYLKACKMYSLRCNRKELMNRNQTK